MVKIFIGSGSTRLDSDETVSDASPPLFRPGLSAGNLCAMNRAVPRSWRVELGRVSMTHHRLSHGAWVFVGDGQKALFLINEGDEKLPNLRCLAAEEHPDPPSHEQGSDAPGRAYSSVGEIRSAVAETDWHQLEKERFAASIAERINA